MLLLAAVVAVGAFVVLRSDEDAPAGQSASNPPPTATATAEPSNDETASATATPSPTPTPRPKPRLPVLTAAKVTRLEVREGQTVRFAARAAEDDEVHVHGYDLSKDAPAGKTVRMSFRATITGIFEIEFEHAGKPIAELRVEP